MHQLVSVNKSKCSHRDPTALSALQHCQANQLTWLTQCASSMTNRANLSREANRRMIPLIYPPMDIISGVTYTTLVHGSGESICSWAALLSVCDISPVYAIAGIPSLHRCRVWSLMREIRGETTKVMPRVLPPEQIAGSWSGR